jgi:hypothetical protein
MASGLLGFNDLTAATNTTVYTVPSSVTSSFAVNFTNRNITPVTVRLAICATSTPANGEYVIYDVIIQGSSSLERTGLVAQTGKLVVAYSNTANVSVQAYGYEV